MSTLRPHWLKAALAVALLGCLACEAPAPGAEDGPDDATAGAPAEDAMPGGEPIDGASPDLGAPEPQPEADAGSVEPPPDGDPRATRNRLVVVGGHTDGAAFSSFGGAGAHSRSRSPRYQTINHLLP